MSIVTLRDDAPAKLVTQTGDMLHEVCRTLVRSKVWSGAQLA